MSVGTAPSAPAYAAYAGLHRWSVADYHRFIELGILTEDDRVELLEGNVVNKMPRNPPHDVAVQRLNNRLVRMNLAGWETRIQSAITLSDSEPEPDAVLARGDESTYARRHPQPGEIGLVVEVSASSLLIDRVDKGRIYAHAGLPVYWIINVIDCQVEVYTDPRPFDPIPNYAARTDYRIGDSVPLVLDGRQIPQLPVAELVA
jgi:Uma2 family endonuclease